MSTIAHYLNGEHVASGKGFLPITNPATGDVIRKVHLATTDELDQAVSNATAAFAAWSERPPLARARILFRFKAILDERIDELAAIITEEHGKTIDDAKGEIVRGIEVVEFACGIPYLLRGNHNQNIGREIDGWSIHQPLGIVAGITPFNFPVMIGLWMAPIALACGNCFILKPSEKDPRQPSSLPNGSPKPVCPRASIRYCRATTPLPAPSSNIQKLPQSALSALPRSPKQSTPTPQSEASACKRWAAPRTISSSAPQQT